MLIHPMTSFFSYSLAELLWSGTVFYDIMPESVVSITVWNPMPADTIPLASTEIHRCRMNFYLKHSFFIAITNALQRQFHFISLN